MVANLVKEELNRIFHAGKISDSAYNNIKKWLADQNYKTEPDSLNEIGQLIKNEQFEELEDSFYTIIPFGTGGRRGKMGIGCNRINLVTIGESAQGFANFLIKRNKAGKKIKLVIAYDTRHNSKTYAEEVARVFAGNNIHVYLFEEYRPTPELSYAIRKLKADGGVVISASHNPPVDNGFKAYFEDGGQIVPPFDELIIKEVNTVTEIKRMELNRAQEKELLEYIGAEIDEEYWNDILTLSFSPEKQKAIKIVYTPLHGTGIKSVVPILKMAGFKDISLVEKQVSPDGNFPNVKDNKPNPESPSALAEGINIAKSINADIVLATDPDADRLGVAVRENYDLGKDDNWICLSGNQIAILLVYYVLSQLKQAAKLPANGIIFRTLVTTSAIDDIAERFNVKVENNLLVGFKYIAKAINELPDPHAFIFGVEESHGYLSGTFIRDKCSSIGALLIAEFADILKKKELTLYQKLQNIYCEYGYYRDIGGAIYLEGSEGSRNINLIMERLRANPPTQIGGIKILEVADRFSGEVKRPDTNEIINPAEGDKGDLLIFKLSEDNRTRITVRPSGTEPKMKFYVSDYAPAKEGQSKEDFERLKPGVDIRAENLLKAVQNLAHKIIL
jgi:phosphoglucomutase